MIAPHSARRPFARRELSVAVQLALTALMAAAAGSAAAQTAAPAEPAQRQEKIEVTGSSIKRLEGEAALPVQVIKREEIDKTGVTTAAELLTKVSANSGGLTDGASTTDITSGQRGFNSASLRGLGASSTLVLLNGRRLANFASPGDSQGVDLNNIPAAAIQRVEILKDGASAIYGTDAIAGVINFITRSDYKGIDVSAYAAGTQQGGAGKTTATATFGFGDLARDRYNVFAVVDFQKLDALRSSQRDFIARNDIPNTLGFLLSSFPYPANINLTTAQRNQLNAGGGYGFTVNRVNFSWPNCNPPASVFTASGPGGRNGCTYNYMADTEIYPEAEKFGFLGRAVFQINDDTQAFAEYMQSRAVTNYVLSPATFRIRNVPAAVVPQLAAAGVTGNVDVRLRAKEVGNRSNEVTSDGQRLVLGLSGVAAGWDYSAAYNHSVNKVADRYYDGYFLFTPMTNGVRAGTINLFGPSGAAGQALIASSRINDEARKSKGEMDSLDIKGSRTLARLEGGDMALALGFETRRERTAFTPSPLLISNEIQGDRDSSGTSPPLVATSSSRTVTAVYAELNAPFTRQLEAQFAVRHDRYSGIGSTTNPKLGVRYQPSRQLVLRGSAGTGFRAPSISELTRPTVFGVTASVLPDPTLCRPGGNLADCSDQWPVERRSNPNLKPEKSRQASLGLVFEPNAMVAVSVDYWNLRKTDVIKDLGEETVLANPQRYASLITRDADGFITNIVLQKQNQGVLKTSGVDLSLDLRFAPTDIGRFSANLTGTYVIDYKLQPGAGEAFYSNVGRFVNDKVVQRWRHRLAINWDRGPVGLTLANTHYSGYVDQNSAIDLNTGARVKENKVGAYSLWDLTGSYQVSKNFKLRAGVLNLLNTMPPFSNQAYYFLASYDPTYTDPRGRTYYLSGSYSFK
jgi:iron complex outermembrane receptor protein